MFTSQTLGRNFLYFSIIGVITYLISDFYLKPINPNLVSELSYPDYSLYKEDSNLRKPKGFYIVSESFARQLLLEGALVSYCFGFWIWGRETDATCLLSQDHFVQKIILKDPFL